MKAKTLQFYLLNVPTYSYLSSNSLVDEMLEDEMINPFSPILAQKKKTKKLNNTPQDNKKKKKRIKVSEHDLT